MKQGEYIGVHVIGPQGNIIKVLKPPRDTKFNDMEIVTPGHTIISVLSIYKVYTGKAVIYIAGSRKAEALNIAKQLGHEVKSFLDHGEVVGHEV